MYDLEDFERLDREFPELMLDSLDELSFEIPFSNDRLLDAARQRKYSTFSFYSEAEFWQSYATFRSQLRNWSNSFYTAEIGRIIFRCR